MPTAPVVKAPPNLTPEQQVKVMGAATDAAASQDGTDHIEKDVQNLIDKTREIRKIFSDTTATLHAIDTAKGNDGKPLNDTGKDFTPRWKGFSDNFEDLIASSTTIATKLGMSCINFETSLIPPLLDTTSRDRMSIQEKRRSVETFMKVTDAGAKDARSTKKGFTDLHTALNEFAGAFGEFATDRLNEDKKQLALWNLEIEKANAAIRKLQNNISIWMVSIGITIFGALAAGVLFPGFGLVVVAAGLNAVIGEGAAIVKLVDEIHEWEDYKATYVDKVADLQKEVDSIYKCQQDLKTVKGSTIPNICSALASFEDIWQSVKGHCESISTVLALVDGDTKLKFSEKVCKSYIDKNKTIFGPIGRALKKYGELQANTNASGFFVEDHVPTDLLAWGNSHPLLKVKVEAVFKSYNFPITTV